MLGNRRRSTEQRQQDEMGSRHDSDHSLGSQTMSRICTLQQLQLPSRSRPPQQTERRRGAEAIAAADKLYLSRGRSAWERSCWETDDARWSSASKTRWARDMIATTVWGRRRCREYARYSSCSFHHGAARLNKRSGDVEQKQ